jgi:hypothetical protein
MSNNNFITLENYKDSNILKGFVQEQKVQHTFESIEKSLHEGFEKGLISEDLLEKSLEELDLIKGGEGSRGGKIIGHTRSGKPVYEAKMFTNKKPETQKHSEKEFKVGHVVSTNGGRHVISEINGDKVKLMDNEGVHDAKISDLKHEGEKYDIEKYKKFNENMYRSKHDVDGAPTSRIEKKKNGKYSAIYNTRHNGDYETPEEAEAKLVSHHEKVKELHGGKGQRKNWDD